MKIDLKTNKKDKIMFNSKVSPNKIEILVSPTVQTIKSQKREVMQMKIV